MEKLKEKQIIILKHVQNMLKVRLLAKRLLIKCNDNLKCSSTGTPKTIDFPFGTNGKLMAIGFPIFTHNSLG